MSAAFQKSKYGVRNDAAGVAARTFDGIKFDSKAEMKRYQELKLMLQLKIIRDLERQPKFHCEVNEQKICTYIADFAYFDIPSKKLVYEDVKGVKTPMYRLKKKLVRALFKVEIQEV